MDLDALRGHWTEIDEFDPSPQRRHTDPGISELVMNGERGLWTITQADTTILAGASVDLKLKSGRLEIKRRDAKQSRSAFLVRFARDTLGLETIDAASVGMRRGAKFWFVRRRVQQRWMNQVSQRLYGN